MSFTNGFKQAGTTTRVAAIVLTAALGMATAVHAQPGRAGGRGNPGGPGGPMAGIFGLHVDVPLRALSLTDAQREQVRAVLQSHRQEAQALAERGRGALQGIRKASGDAVDEASIGQHSQALAAAIGESAVLRARVRQEVYALLTPEQQAEAAKLQAERQARAEERRERRQQRQSRGQPRG